jgi:hypothetical protein
MSNWRMIMNDELGRIWKWPWSVLRYYPRICLGGLKKTTKSQPGWPAFGTKIETWNLQNLKQEC